MFDRYASAVIEYAVEYEFYQNPGEMLAAYARQERKADMYILDIEMPGMDGLAVAREIRNRDSRTLIVFLTSYTKYMPDVFEVVTFDYIQKPITAERLRMLLEKGGTGLIVNTDCHIMYVYYFHHYHNQLHDISDDRKIHRYGREKA